MPSDAQNLITNEIYKLSSDLKLGCVFFQLVEGNLQHPAEEGKL
jgi:hypothetical protein